MPGDCSLPVSEQAALERNKDWVRPGEESLPVFFFTESTGLLETLGNDNNNHQGAILRIFHNRCGTSSDQSEWTS